MAQLSVLDFMRVKNKQMRLDEAVAKRRAEEGDATDRETAKRKLKAREHAKRAAEEADEKRRAETTRKILDASRCEKDAFGYLILQSNQVYIGNAYPLAEGRGWASASVWSIPKDLRAQIPAFGSVPNIERDRVAATVREAYRRRLLADRSAVDALVRSLSGKQLVCTCRSDDRCHGPMLLTIIEEELARREEEKRFNIIRVPQIVTDPDVLLRRQTDTMKTL